MPPASFFACLGRGHPGCGRRPGRVHPCESVSHKAFIRLQRNLAEICETQEVVCASNLWASMTPQGAGGGEDKKQRMMQVATWQNKANLAGEGQRAKAQRHKAEGPWMGRCAKQSQLGGRAAGGRTSLQERSYIWCVVGSGRRGTNPISRWRGRVPCPRRMRSPCRAPEACARNKASLAGAASREKGSGRAIPFGGRKPI
jgi:hypothetical protein